MTLPSNIKSLTDQELVKALLNRDPDISREFLYRKCYPLFKSIFDKYYTDCDSCIELINEIYIYILFPNKHTGLSKLQTFGFRCSLTLWLKIVAENYCRQLYAKRLPLDLNSPLSGDIILPDDQSIYANTHRFDSDDVRKILAMMPNQRYRNLIEYHYIQGKSHEETAMLLGLTMAIYYNKHKLAKAQYCEALRKEGLL